VEKKPAMKEQDLADALAEFAGQVCEHFDSIEYCIAELKLILECIHTAIHGLDKAAGWPITELSGIEEAFNRLAAAAHRLREKLLSTEGIEDD